MASHWRVEVWCDGESVVAIETNMLAGRELSPEDEEAIREAGRNLLAFVGDGEASGFDPDED